MYNTTPIAEFIGGLLKDCRLAVLATEGSGQPHASLIAITPFRGLREIIFATYKNTRKYGNLKLNGRVAVSSREKLRIVQARIRPSPLLLLAILQSLPCQNWKL